MARQPENQEVEAERCQSENLVAVVEDRNQHQVTGSSQVKEGQEVEEVQTASKLKGDVRYKESDMSE